MIFNSRVQYLFRTPNTVINELIQTKLFKRGINWGISGEGVKHTNAQGLVIKNRRIRYLNNIDSSSTIRHIQEQQMREIDTERFIYYDHLLEQFNQPTN